MSKLKLWCKGNYNKISLLFCLLFCLIAVLSKSAFLMCILVLCLALQIVVFVITPTVTVTDASNSQWYKVKLSDGTEGYLF